MDEIILIGILVSLIYTEATGISPGGLIIPSYFALHITDLKRVIFTIILSILAIYVVKFIGKYTILYGRRRFAIYVASGILLKMMFSMPYLSSIMMFSNFSITIGYLVPGILGKDIEKQGCFKTLSSLFIVVFIVKIIQIAFLL